MGDAALTALADPAGINGRRRLPPVQRLERTKNTSADNLRVITAFSNLSHNDSKETLLKSPPLLNVVINGL